MVFTSPKNDVAEQLRQMINQLPSNDDGDDAVARVKARSTPDTVEIVGIWLSGARLSDWYTNVNQEYKPMEPRKVIQLERNRAWQLLNQNDLPMGLNTTYKQQPLEMQRATIHA